MLFNRAQLLGWFILAGSLASAQKTAEKLDKILRAGISINMYMFHGGTTRDFMNGANMNVNDPYAPQTSSYDYDAPLDEAGNATEKFFAFRDVIEKYLPADDPLPPFNDELLPVPIKDIKLNSYAGLFNNLPKPVSSVKPLSFEELDQAYGFVLYRSQISASGYLKLDKLRDYAIIFINGQQVGTLDRRLKQDSLMLENVPVNATLDLLVENNGRINYGPYLTDNRKGILGTVTLGNLEVKNWKMYSLPFQTIKGVSFGAAGNQPGFYKGTFDVPQIFDTYLDLRTFGKGFVFLNGHNLGKYWNIGPQQTLYIPACWLKNTNNEIIIFDELKSGHTSISTLVKPILNQPAK